MVCKLDLNIICIASIIEVYGGCCFTQKVMKVSLHWFNFPHFLLIYILIYMIIYAFQLIEDKTDLRHKTVEQLKEKD